MSDQCVSKILTPRRKLKKTSLIAKLSAETKAFRICMTCYRWKSIVLPGKHFFSPKTPKNSLFWRQGIWVVWLWEKLLQLYAKLLGLGLRLGCPWKVWGITVQTSYREGLWHQNCGYTSPILFFEAARETSEKRHFFVNCSVPENGKNFRSKYPRNPYAPGIQKIYVKGGYNKSLTLFWSPEVGWVRWNATR